jgi:hypothetical protein
LSPSELSSLTVVASRYIYCIAILVPFFHRRRRFLVKGSQLLFNFGCALSLAFDGRKETTYDADFVLEEEEER